MGKFYFFSGISIYIYSREHNPPHIHAFYAEYEGLLRISDGVIIKGHLPKRQLAMVQMWIDDQAVKKTLMKVFKQQNPHLRN